uniref:Uncharacterized protein n=1 Tax=Tanacetum cinerariifolium TaxID=118510 RepID=A0A699GEJ0_TANCI|nr:hypothetical protein [Tanacetum cinerariifolium]
MFFSRLFHHFDIRADQVIERGQCRLRAFAGGDDDLLVRHGGDIAGSKHAGDRRLAAGIDFDLAVTRQGHRALEPLGVGHQADLHEHAFQVDLFGLARHAVVVRQAVDDLAVAVHFGRLRRDDHRHVGQAAQLALQHRVGAQFCAVFDQGHVLDQAGQIDGRFHARVAAADHGHALALEQRTVAVRAVRHALVAVFLLAGHVDFAPAGAGGQDHGFGFQHCAAGRLHFHQLGARYQLGSALGVHDVHFVRLDVLFQCHGKLRTVGFLDRNEVFNRHGVEHLAAETLGQHAGLDALAGGVDGRCRTGRTAADDQHVKHVFLAQRGCLADAGIGVELGEDFLDIGAALAEVLAVQEHHRHGHDLALFHFFREHAAVDGGDLDARVDHRHGVQCLHDFRAVMARQRNKGFELEVAVEIADLLDDGVVELDGVAAYLQQGQHQRSEFVAHRHTGKTHADVGACTVDAERRSAYASFQALDQRDLVAQQDDFLEQFLHLAGLGAAYAGPDARSGIAQFRRVAADAVVVHFHDLDLAFRIDHEGAAQCQAFFFDHHFEVTRQLAGWVADQRVVHFLDGVRRVVPCLVCEMGVGRYAVHVHAQLGEFRLLLGQIFQFGWAHEGEVGWVEHQDGPLAFQGFVADFDEFTVNISGGIEWLDLGIDQGHVPGTQEGVEIRCRHRFRKQIALAVVAAGVGQQIALLRGFHAFRNHFQAQLVGHDDDRFRQGHVARVRRQVAGERAVDFQVIDIELFQVRQRRIAGAEIVERDLDAGVAQLQQLVADGGVDVEQQPLGDFHHQRLPGQPQRAQVLQPGCIAAVLALEFQRRLVEADLERGIDLAPPALGPAGPGLEHPLADVEDQPARFGQRNEFGRADHAALRVAPADQGLGLMDASAGQVDDGLEVQRQLVVLDGAAQVVGHAHAVQGGNLQRGREVGKAVAAGALGRVHGLVRMLEQVVDVEPVVRVQRDADAGRHERLLLPQRKRRLQAVDDLLGDLLHPLRFVELGKDHREFIAAQARHRIGRPHARADAARRLHQQDVALVVAQGVVDFLEVVEVDEQDGQPRVLAPALDQVLLQAVEQHAAVGQLGQRIEIGLLPDQRLALLGGGHILDHAQVVRVQAVFRIDGGDRHVDPGQNAVGADHAAGAFESGNAPHHQQTHLLLVLRHVVRMGDVEPFMGAQFGQRAAHDFQVAVVDVAVFVGDRVDQRHAQRRCFEHGAKPPLALADGRRRAAPLARQQTEVHGARAQQQQGGRPQHAVQPDAGGTAVGVVQEAVEIHLGRQHAQAGVHVGDMAPAGGIHVADLDQDGLHQRHHLARFVQQVLAVVAARVFIEDQVGRLLVMVHGPVPAAQAGRAERPHPRRVAGQLALAGEQRRRAVHRHCPCRWPWNRAWRAGRAAGRYRAQRRALAAWPAHRPNAEKSRPAPPPAGPTAAPAAGCCCPRRTRPCRTPRRARPGCCRPPPQCARPAPLRGNNPVPAPRNSRQTGTGSSRRSARISEQSISGPQSVSVRNADRRGGIGVAAIAQLSVAVQAPGPQAQGFAVGLEGGAVVSAGRHRFPRVQAAHLERQQAAGHALTQLAFVAAAPGPQRAIVAHANGVAHAACHLGPARAAVADLGGRRLQAGAVVADLAVVALAPGKQHAVVVADGQRMVAAGRHGRPVGRADLGGHAHLAGRQTVTQLAMAVIAPGPQALVAAPDGQRVGVAGRHGQPGIGAEAGGDQQVHRLAVAQLACIIISPHPQRHGGAAGAASGGAQCHHVRLAHCHRGPVLGRAHLGRNITRHLVALAQLAEQVIAPRPQRAVGADRHGKTVAHGHLLPDIAVARNRDRGIAARIGAVTELALDVQAPAVQAAIGLEGDGLVAAGGHLGPRRDGREIEGRRHGGGRGGGGLGGNHALGADGLGADDAGAGHLQHRRAARLGGPRQAGERLGGAVRISAGGGEGLAGAVDDQRGCGRRDGNAAQRDHGRRGGAATAVAAAAPAAARRKHGKQRHQPDMGNCEGFHGSPGHVGYLSPV